MQTMPAFCYLAPMALVFGIGSGVAVVLTVIYALPPIVRITEHGLRTVPATTIEAANSMGLTRRQLLRHGPAADGQADHRGRHQPVHDGRPVDGDHRGARQRPRPRQALVVAALQIENVGAASVAGLAIVVMAIMLDRSTTAASERGANRGRSDIGSVSGPGVHLAGVMLERLPRWATEDAGKGQRSATSDDGGPLVDQRAAVHPRGHLHRAVPAAARPGRLPGRDRHPGPEVVQRARADQADQRLHRLVRGHTSTPSRSR